MPLDFYIELLGEPPFGYGEDGPRETEGAEKLGMQFLFNFMTEVGTDPQDLTRGTVFPRLIGGNVADAQDAADITAQAVDQNVTWMQEQQLGLDLPDEEVLQSATLLGVEATPNGDGIDAYITVTNILGQSVPVRARTQ